MFPEQRPLRLQYNLVREKGIRVPLTSPSKAGSQPGISITGTRGKGNRELSLKFRIVFRLCVNVHHDPD
jgi:hypothetical protein